MCPVITVMDGQFYLARGSRWAVGFVVVAMSALFGSVAPLEVSAQSTPAAGGPLPPMPTPGDNPQIDAKIKLGRELYFDGRLSANNEISCATCHDPKTGWAGHDATDTGVGGRVGNRNSGTIVNSGYMKYQFWDGRAGSLEEQALGPIHNPVEMGETLENVVRKLTRFPATSVSSRRSSTPMSLPMELRKQSPLSRGRSFPDPHVTIGSFKAIKKP